MLCFFPGKILLYESTNMENGSNWRVVALREFRVVRESLDKSDWLSDCSLQFTKLVLQYSNLHLSIWVLATVLMSGVDSGPMKIGFRTTEGARRK